MSTAEAEATEFDAATKELGDKIVGLTLLEVKKVVDYLKEAHNIEPAGGGGVVIGVTNDDGRDAQRVLVHVVALGRAPRVGVRRRRGERACSLKRVVVDLLDGVRRQ